METTYTIGHGDCLQLMRSIPDGSVDMVLCDLPYGTTQNKWDTVIPFEPLWEQYRRITKPSAAIVLFGSQPFSSALVMSNQAWLRYQWVWDKGAATGHLNAKRTPMKQHEEVHVFYEKPPVYNPQGLQPFNKTIRRGGTGQTSAHPARRTSSNSRTTLGLFSGSAETQSHSTQHKNLSR